jgi:hypothetical protein
MTQRISEANMVDESNPHRDVLSRSQNRRAVGNGPEILLPDNSTVTIRRPKGERDESC